jgi:two-component system CheB/CheR fusion protein
VSSPRLRASPVSVLRAACMDIESDPRHDPEEVEPPHSVPAEALAAAPTIVAIGASAGGLDALKRFFGVMPQHPRIAFVVVVHLSPTHPSLLAEILSKNMEMPVRQIQDGDRVEPAHVYVIPPNRYLKITRGTLHLEPSVVRPAIPLPIDHFMRSLADDQQTLAAGIVLTGADHDGTIGLKEIKAAGGLTIAQEPSTAQHAGMPMSALEAGPDWVLPIEQIPRALIDYVEHRTPAVVPPPVSSSSSSEDGEVPLQEIFEVLRSRTGREFRGYRPGMLLRRIGRRMALNRLTHVREYLERLRESPEEANALSKDFLIGVTSFFRDPEAWETLDAHVVQPLLKEKPPDAVLRVWSAGCATGEEAYSVAMLLLDRINDTGRPMKLQVFASDIDGEALQVGRAGVYSSNVEVTIPIDRLRRFFRKNGNVYEVRKDLRDAVLFSPQNVLSDPPFSRLDLIVCRNLLIYLEPHLQHGVLELFHFALNPGGTLFLGKSETLGLQGPQFEPVIKPWRIYRSIGQVGSVPRDLPLRAEAPAFAFRGVPRETRPADLGQLTRELLLDRHAPAAVLVNREYQVLYFYGRTGEYLAQPTGEPNWDLPSLARGEIGPKLRAALYQAVSDGRKVSIECRIKRGTGRSLIGIDVEPVNGLLLVTFADRQSAEPPAPAEAVRPLDDAAAMRQLEEELRVTRSDLQSAINDLESLNEELRVSNEEALSMNEELQSSNEELQTSKEELQSLNEELVTVNTQLEDKVRELEHTADDLGNLLSSTHIPTLFLDRQFRIQRFTKAATHLFKLIPSDLNRPLGDITSRLADGALQTEARRVLDSLAPDEREVESDSGEWYLRRILPYRTADDRIDGVVVTFTDISALRRATEHQRRLATVVRDSNDAIIGYAFDGQILSWNQAAERTYGYQEAEAVTMNVAALVPEAQRDSERALAARVRAGESVDPLDSRRQTRDGRTLDVSLTLSALRDDAGRIVSLVSTERDITDRKRFEQVLRESEARFRDLSDSVPALVWMLDARHQMQFVNRSFVEFTGRPADTLVGEGWLLLVHPSDVAGYRRQYREALAHESRVETDLRVRRADGEYRWLHLVGVPRYGQDGEFVGYVGLTIDVHERRLAEQSLSEADHRKDEFLAMLAHELRNPLAPIRTAVELINRRSSSDQHLTWAAAVIDRQTHQLTRLIDDLLDVARISSGKVSLERHSLDINTVIERAVETSRPLIDARRQQLTVSVEPSLWVDGDLLRLSQVIANLLSNASKFTPEGGRIDVRAAREGGEVAISVADNGAGIAEDMIDRVFDLFTQAHSTLDRSQGGLGLGLSLVQRLVLLHGGHVEARSAGPGQGSTFVVRLPVLATASAVPASVPRAEVNGSGPSLRVLVVDDNADAAESICVYLTMEGHDVRTAHDGETALEIAEAFLPEVVVLDIGLPGLNGYDVARELRARPKTAHALLIALTGYGQPQDAFRSKAAGFDHHVVKPVQPERLSDLLSKVRQNRGGTGSGGRTGST